MNERPIVTLMVGCGNCHHGFPARVQGPIYFYPHELPRCPLCAHSTLDNGSTFMVMESAS